MDAWLDLRIAAKWLAAPDVVVLDLVTPERTALPRFEAGAYIDVQIPASPCGTTAGLVRPYSLCNAPHESQIYRIAVQRGRHSRGASAYLHGHTQVGGLLRVQHPRNEFPLCRSAVYTCLLAGGIGVAPLLAMAEDAWHRGAAFALHYSARTARLAAFADALAHAPYRHQVHFHWSDEPTGRLDFERCLATVPSLSHLYLCGPAGYVAHALKAAVGRRWPSERLHLERFG